MYLNRPTNKSASLNVRPGVRRGGELLKAAYAMGNGRSGVKEGGVRDEERQRLLRVVSGLRGGLVLRVWTWYGGGGDVPPARAAGSAGSHSTCRTRRSGQREGATGLQAAAIRKGQDGAA
ncbi:hypothetical protein FB451DRAFT_1180089 [Mycena latifolia]|nr:hypothetical protein FB451DRAFT_1180089 [Mycena latifolia]